MYNPQTQTKGGGMLEGWQVQGGGRIKGKNYNSIMNKTYLKKI